MPAYPEPRGNGRGWHFCGKRAAASGMIRITLAAEARFECGLVLERIAEDERPELACIPAFSQTGPGMSAEARLS